MTASRRRYDMNQAHQHTLHSHSLRLAGQSRCKVRRRMERLTDTGQGTDVLSAGVRYSRAEWAGVTSVFDTTEANDERSPRCMERVDGVP